MSKIADYYLRRVEDLAAETGYSFDFLYECYIECMEENGDFGYFEAVTRERDW